MREPNDLGLERLQRIAGLASSQEGAANDRVQAPKLSAWERRQLAYQREMAKLQAAGADYQGTEQLRRAIQRLSGGARG